MVGEIDITFIINGEDVTVQARQEQKLEELRLQALAQSHNTGRSPDAWAVRSDGGVLLSTDATVEELGILDGARLFLTLAIGAGGSEAVVAA